MQHLQYGFVSPDGATCPSCKPRVADSCDCSRSHLMTTVQLAAKSRDIWTV